ncbi:MAG: FGGY family carbohydrate kinase [Lachnospiraceae bacterium]|nr:FGGY family carbohydrate kinase [Lachnospiraceae bacterium]
MKAMGIDLGTTSISMIMVDGESGTLIGSRTVNSDAFISGMHASSREQDPGKILDHVIRGLYELTGAYGRPDVIGMTGQMHGMLYVDDKGEAVSPLFTWQDGSGSIPIRDGKSAVQILKEMGLAAASGFGLTTHMYLTMIGKVPERASGMVTISDYAAMKLTGRTEPFIASDMAASWGCFNLRDKTFEEENISRAGMDTSFIPVVFKDHPIIGYVSDTFGELAGIPVAASLGDNQASFIGSVNDVNGTLLLNVGTGSQVSFATDRFISCEGAVELRPCTGDQYLLAGSSLCGGRAYAMLENFFREIAAAGRNGSAASEHSFSMFGLMEKWAGDYYNDHGTGSAWKVRTTFNGTRSNPGERGSFSEIGTDNFHPGALTLGLMQGMLHELYEMYREMCRLSGSKASVVVGSGNAIRKNPLLRRLAGEMFGKNILVPCHSEEAAYGAALAAMAAAGLVKNLHAAQQLIRFGVE